MNTEQKMVNAFMQILRDNQDMFIAVSDQHIADLIQHIEACSQERFTKEAFSAIQSFCRHYPAIREVLLTKDSRGPKNTGYPLPNDTQKYKQELLILINAVRINQTSKTQDDVKERLKNDSTRRTS